MTFAFAPILVKTFKVRGKGVRNRIPRGKGVRNRIPFSVPDTFSIPKPGHPARNHAHESSRATPPTCVFSKHLFQVITALFSEITSGRIAAST